MVDLFVGWLSWVSRLFDNHYLAVSRRDKKKKRDIIEKRKLSKQPTSAHLASTVGFCRTIIQISGAPWH